MNNTNNANMNVTLDAVQRLRDAGATRIVVKPDGTVEGEFGAQQPCLLPHYPQQSPWWPWPQQPFWWGVTTYGTDQIGDIGGPGDSGSTVQFPHITWTVNS